VSDRPWWRQPLVHFLAFGLVAYAVGVWRTEEPIPGQVVRDAEVVVDAGVIAELTRQFQATFARDPGPGDLDHAVEAWIREEILVREARALGLDRGDVQVRGRLAEKMAFVAGVREVPIQPTEADLRSLYAARRDELVLQTRLTLRQLFATDRAAAEALLARWEEGADPRALGRDRSSPPGGPVLRARTPEGLAELYGERFSTAVSSMQVGERALVASDLGWHAVEVVTRREGGTMSFEQARDRLALWWRTRARAEAQEAAIDTLSTHCGVVGWPR